MTSKPRWAVAGLLATAALAAGCGGDDDSGGTDTGSGQASTPAAPGAVGMKDIQFDPEEITVKVGEKVTWTNNEPISHDVAATKGADFKSDIFGEGGTFSFTPTKAGTISYECTLHPGMEGTIEVTS